MPINVEQKINHDPTSKGQHFAEEINTSTNTINKPIEVFGEQNPNSDDEQLIAALSAMQTDIVYKGILDTSKNPNELTLKSLSSPYLKKYVSSGKLLYTVDVENTGPVKIGVDRLSKKDILGKDGNPLTGGEMKPGMLFIFDSNAPNTQQRLETIGVDGDSVRTNRGDLSGVDLNDVKSLGDYQQGDSSKATSNKHYPVEIGGILSTTPYPNGDVLQTYNTEDGRLFSRLYNNPSWGEWEEIGKEDDREILGVVSKIPLGTEDLNNKKIEGVYRQTIDSNATLNRHYPIANKVGILHVIRMGDNNNGNPIILQRYDLQDNAFYERRFNGSSWTEWKSYAYTGHTHDEYLSIDEADTRYVSSDEQFVDEQSNSNTLNSDTWYTIATLQKGRGLAEFNVIDTTASHHTNLNFTVSSLYNGHPLIFINTYSYYKNNPIKAIRCLKGGTNDGLILQIKIGENNLESTRVRLLRNLSITPFIVKPFILDGTDPGDVNGYDNVNIEVSKIPLTDIVGTMTGGDMYIKGDIITDNYKVDNTSSSLTLRDKLNNIIFSYIYSSKTFKMFGSLLVDKIRSLTGNGLIISIGESRDKGGFTQGTESLMVEAESGVEVATPDRDHSNWQDGYTLKKSQLLGDSLSLDGEVLESKMIKKSPLFRRELGDGVDLNNIIEAGIYSQINNNQASLNNNYPIEYAGLLEVKVDSGYSDMIWQTYTTYLTHQDIYTRSHHNGIWGEWSLTLTKDNFSKTISKKDVNPMIKPVNIGTFLFNTPTTYGSVTQSLTFDRYRNDLWGIQIKNGNNVIIKYSYPWSSLETLGIAKEFETDELNTHQGLAVAYHNGGRYFLSQRGTSGEINIFRINGNYEIYDRRTIKVFDTNSSGYCTVSSDNNNDYIAVEGVVDGIQYVSIYDIKTLKDNDDVTDKYLYRISIGKYDSSKFPLQGLTIDDTYLYIAYGDSDKTNANFLRVYNYKTGEYKEGCNITLGIDPDDDNYEQESIFWYNGKLCTSIMLGTYPNHTKKVYALTNDISIGFASYAIDQTNRSDILGSSSVIGSAKNLNVDRVYFRPSRLNNMVFINSYLNISGFSTAFPTDDPLNIYMDIYKLGNELGIFNAYTAGAFGGSASIIFYDSEMNDSITVNGYMLINNDYLRIYVPELDTGKNVTYTSCKINMITFLKV